MERPYEFELIPIGIYNDINIDGAIWIFDDSYIVYTQAPNLEYDCEVIFD